MPFSSFKAVADMELKILFIAVLFIGACAGFYLPDDQDGKLMGFSIEIN